MKYMKFAFLLVILLLCETKVQGQQDNQRKQPNLQKSSLENEPLVSQTEISSSASSRDSEVELTKVEQQITNEQGENTLIPKQSYQEEQIPQSSQTEIKVQEKRKLKVHIVPHSHMDAGWLKTHDTLYAVGASRIFTSVFDQLINNPSYTYTIGDIYFFRRFYFDQPVEVRQSIKELVHSGQIDFVHGGMVSTDEATPNYDAILHNFKMGFDFLLTEFGVRPKVCWQLDPFGHSAAFAKLASMMGFEALVFARINEDHKIVLKTQKDLEFRWKPQFETKDMSFHGSSNIDGTDLFTHILYNHYNPGFLIVEESYKYLNAPSMQPKSMSSLDFNSLTQKLIKQVHEMAQVARHDNILILWGDDFSHIFANQTYLIYEKLQEQLQKYTKSANDLLKQEPENAKEMPFFANYEITMEMSTMTNYFNDVFEQSKANKIEYNVYKEDFWAYHNVGNPLTYWSGYFSTFQKIKKEIMDFTDLVHAFLHFNSFTIAKDDTELAHMLYLQDKALEALSITLHHDAITGTHTIQTGEAYQSMMSKVSEFLVQHIVDNGISSYLELLGITIHQTSNSTSSTIEIESLTKASNDTSPPSDKLLLIYNPNIEAQPGIWLTTTRYMVQKVGMELRQVNLYTKGWYPQNVGAEAICDIDTDLNDQSSSMQDLDTVKCRIFVDTYFKGLETTVIKIVHGRSQNSINEIQRKTVFKINPSLIPPKKIVKESKEAPNKVEDQDNLKEEKVLTANREEISTNQKVDIKEEVLQQQDFVLTSRASVADLIANLKSDPLQKKQLQNTEIISHVDIESKEQDSKQESMEALVDQDLIEKAKELNKVDLQRNRDLNSQTVDQNVVSSSLPSIKERISNNQSSSNVQNAQNTTTITTITTVSNSTEDGEKWDSFTEISMSRKPITFRGRKNQMLQIWPINWETIGKPIPLKVKGQGGGTQRELQFGLKFVYDQEYATSQSTKDQKEGSGFDETNSQYESEEYHYRQSQKNFSRKYSGPYMISTADYHTLDFINITAVHVYTGNIIQQVEYDFIDTKAELSLQRDCNTTYSDACQSQRYRNQSLYVGNCTSERMDHDLESEYKEDKDSSELRQAFNQMRRKVQNQCRDEFELVFNEPEFCGSQIKERDDCLEQVRLDFYQFNRSSKFYNTTHGKIIFTLEPDSLDIKQRIILPRVTPGKGGREIFGEWYLDVEREVQNFYTDSNGLEVVKRPVFNLSSEEDSSPFAATLYPVTSMIGISEINKCNFFIKNDRPQAGTMHQDGRIKLLIDRRVKTNDYGGVPVQSLYSAEQKIEQFPLQLDFSLEISQQNTKIFPPGAAQRLHQLQVFQSSNFTTTKRRNALSTQRISRKQHLVETLKSFGVSQISLTQVPLSHSIQEIEKRMKAANEGRLLRAEQVRNSQKKSSSQEATQEIPVVTSQRIKNGRRLNMIYPLEFFESRTQASEEYSREKLGLKSFGQLEYYDSSRSNDQALQILDPKWSHLQSQVSKELNQIQQQITLDEEAFTSSILTQSQQANTTDSNSTTTEAMLQDLPLSNTPHVDNQKNKTRPDRVYLEEEDKNAEFSVIKVRLDFFGNKNQVFKREILSQSLNQAIEEPTSSFGQWISKGSLKQISWHICAYLLYAEPYHDSICSQVEPLQTGVIGEPTKGIPVKDFDKFVIKTNDIQSRKDRFIAFEIQIPKIFALVDDESPVNLQIERNIKIQKYIDSSNPI